MIAPGSTIGILGGGQLGRMTALAAREMGYRVAVLESNAGCPAAGVADHFIEAGYEDTEGLQRLAAVSDVITYEFENIAVDGLLEAVGNVPLRPGVSVLETSQDREREKALLASCGLPLPPYAVVRSRKELTDALKRIGVPAVLKTARFGYDGKGQQKLDTAKPDGSVAWEQALGLLASGTCVLEGWVRFRGEYSVIVARRPSGGAVAYPVCRNFHRDHILDVTLFPARLDPELEASARRIGLDLAAHVRLEGLLVIELFRTVDDRWLVNEIAPRPHNSGHVTRNGALTSQFEQFVRAITDLPLGRVDPVFPEAAMINILGDSWIGGVPDWGSILAIPGSSLHLYDKGEARRGRKMGHVNLLATDRKRLFERIARVREVLRQPEFDVEAV